MWSEEFSFTLFHSDGHSYGGEAAEVMHPSWLVPTNIMCPKNAVNWLNIMNLSLATFLTRHTVLYYIYYEQQMGKTSKGLNGSYRHCISVKHTLNKENEWVFGYKGRCTMGSWVFLCVTGKTRILCMTATNWHGGHIESIVSFSCKDLTL